MSNKIENDEIEIDLLRLAKALWRRAWLIAVSMILCGAVAFSLAAFFIAPKYQSRAVMYVNNSAYSAGSSSTSTITSSELTAAKSLVEIYVNILTSRTTMELVAEQAGLDYTYEELKKMVSAGSVDSTEMFEIVATSTSPEEAKLIIETITNILPDRISEIVDGSSVRIVDNANLPSSKSSPNVTSITMIGLLLGFIASCGVIIVIELLDNTIHDEDYLMEKYNLPILAAVPDMTSKKKSKSYGYYANN